MAINNEIELVNSKFGHPFIDGNYQVISAASFRNVKGHLDGWQAVVSIFIYAVHLNLVMATLACLSIDRCDKCAF